MDSSPDFYSNLIPPPEEDGDISYLECEVLVHQVMLESLNPEDSNYSNELNRIQTELALLEKRLVNKRKWTMEQEMQADLAKNERDRLDRQRLRAQEVESQAAEAEELERRRLEKRARLQQEILRREDARKRAQEMDFRASHHPSVGTPIEASSSSTGASTNYSSLGTNPNRGGYPPIAPPGYSSIDLTSPSGAISSSSLPSRKRNRPHSWAKDFEQEEGTPYLWQQSQINHGYGSSSTRNSSQAQPQQQPVFTTPPSRATPIKDLTMSAPRAKYLSAGERHQLDADQDIRGQTMGDAAQVHGSVLSPDATRRQVSANDGGLKKRFGSTPNLVQTTLQHDGSIAPSPNQQKSIKRHHADSLLPLSLQQPRSNLDPHRPYSARPSQSNTPMGVSSPFNPPMEHARSSSLGQGSLHNENDFNQFSSLAASPSSSNAMSYGQMSSGFPMAFGESSLSSPMGSAQFDSRSPMHFEDQSGRSSRTAGHTPQPSSNGLRIDTAIAQSSTATSNPQSAITVSDGPPDAIDLTDADWEAINQMNADPQDQQTLFGQQNPMHSSVLGHSAMSRPSQTSPASSSSESFQEISADQFQPNMRTIEMASRARPAGQGMLAAYSQQYGQLMANGMNQQHLNPNMYSFESRPSAAYGNVQGPASGLLPTQGSASTYGLGTPMPYQQQTPQAPSFINNTRTFLDYVSVMGNAVTQQVGRALDNALTGLGSRDFPVEVDENYISSRHAAAPVEERSARETREFLNNVLQEQAVPKEERMDTPTEMNTQLMEHQRVGLTWLMKQEKGVNKGGILGDDMGLGKTIQAIALILSNRSDDPKNKTTLVIAPVALLDQWKTEIAEKIKTEHALKVHKYHAHGAKKTYDQLQEFDVVLTTYGTLSQEFKRYQEFLKMKKIDPNVMPNEKQVFTMIGSNRSWYRAILDESQNIKNKSSLMAKGAFCLSATYRWCMTGTPMMNNVSELWPCIHFCRIKPWDDPIVFRDQISRLISPDGNNRYAGSYGRESAQRGMRKLQRLIGAIMLRRTKKSRLDGKPILQLPERIVHTDPIQFDEEELKFYTELERTAQVTFRRLLSGGTLGRQYTHALVLLLRLRQACCHRHLVLFHENLNNQSWLHESEEKLLAIAKEIPRDAVERIKAEMGNFQCPICLDSTPNPAILLPCGHLSCSECFTQLCDNNARVNESDSMVKCPVCRGDVNPKQVTDFFSFKKVHQPELLTKEELAEDDMSSEDDEEEEEEVEKDDDGDSLKDFVVDDDYVSQDDEDEEEEQKKEEIDEQDYANLSLDDQIKRYNEKKIERRKKQMAKKKVKAEIKAEFKTEFKADVKMPTVKGKVKANKDKEKAKGAGRARIANINDPHERLAVLKKESLRNKSAKKHYFKQLDMEYVPSAKLKRTIELIEQFKREKPQEKILVFSQFTTLLDLMEIPLRRAEIKYVRYDGSMTAAERTKATEQFRQEDDVRVMILSLKAGNAGLNLNIASQVIILDPFWNPYIEEQAIDRAHRIGQRFDVQVHRVVVPNTVEDRILKLQEQKRELIGQALNQEQINTVSGLGNQELRYLFGV